MHHVSGPIGRWLAEKNRGRPRKSTEGLTSLKRSTIPSWGAPDPLQPALFLSPPSTGPQLEDLQCSMCQCIVDRPVETSCKKLACLNCAVDKQVCPLCSQVMNSHLSPASDVILKVAGALLLRCSACSGIVELHDLKTHRESNCTSFTVQQPSDPIITQILSQPPNAPPTHIEEQLASAVVKRILNTSPSRDVLTLPTKGHVRIQNMYSRFD